MGRRSATRLALATALALVFTVPTAAQGTVTIGSNLGRAPDLNVLCDPECTLSPTSLAPSAVLPGGLIAPVNGTVVTWRIRVGDMTGPATFRVLKRFADGFATGAGTSATVTPPVDATTAFSTSLPIAIGETIGMDCCLSESRFEVSGSGTTDFWLPALTNGEAPRDTFGNSPPDPGELALNADIEPTSAFTIVKAKPKKGGKVQVRAQLPNPGILAAGDKSAKLATAAGVKYLKTKSAQVAAPGPFVLVVKATKAARSALADEGKLKAKLKLAFTPNGGAPSTQVRKVKLKP